MLGEDARWFQRLHFCAQTHLLIPQSLVLTKDPGLWGHREEQSEAVLKEMGFCWRKRMQHKQLHSCVGVAVSTERLSCSVFWTRVRASSV